MASGDAISIFLNYRHDDAGGYANHLHADLVARLGEESVFMDLRAIEPGLDFEKAIEAALRRCDVLLCLIGRDWLETDEDGVRRLDDPDDWVRLELEAALARPEVRVVPVLVQRARMPSRSDLPETLVPLRRRQAFELTDAHWRNDVEKLIVDVLEKVARLKAERKAEQNLVQTKETLGTDLNEQQSAAATPTGVSQDVELARGQAKQERPPLNRAEPPKTDPPAAMPMQPEVQKALHHISPMLRRAETVLVGAEALVYKDESRLQKLGSMLSGPTSPLALEVPVYLFVTNERVFVLLRKQYMYGAFKTGPRGEPRVWDIAALKRVRLDAGLKIMRFEFRNRHHEVVHFPAEYVKEARAIVKIWSRLASAAGRRRAP